MKLFLDTEFNGYNGQLLSLALVPADPTLPEFYCELEIHEALDPWVRENVVPHLIIIPSTYNSFQQKLSVYLRSIGVAVIVADWPDDIRYFCSALITGPGERILLSANLAFELDWGIEYTSAVPHNALHDARAIREYYLNKVLV